MKMRQKSKGFTIIEVVLVLAIAGLIFLMVFIALPALQRSQRDTQRKNDLSRLNTALSSYSSNNRGNLPSDWTDFVNRYVKLGETNTFVDPSGTEYVLKPAALPATIPGAFKSTEPNIYITIKATCDGEEITQTDQSARKVAFQMKLEGSGTACVNN